MLAKIFTQKQISNFLTKFGQKKKKKKKIRVTPGNNKMRSQCFY